MGVGASPPTPPTLKRGEIPPFSIPPLWQKKLAGDFVNSVDNPGWLPVLDYLKRDSNEQTRKQRATSDLSEARGATERSEVACITTPRQDPGLNITTSARIKDSTSTNKRPALTTTITSATQRLKPVRALTSIIKRNTK